MYLTLLPLLLTIVTRDMPLDAHHPEAVAVYQCEFSAALDVNHDDWPDGWRRQTGLNYPAWLPILLRDDQSAPTSQRCLRLELDGGAAAVDSPHIPISPLFSYVLEADVRTEKLKHHGAYITITFLDDQQRPLATERSRIVAGSEPWTKLTIGPLSPPHEDAVIAVIGLHLESTGEQFDLTGAASFANVWLARLPRMTLHTNSPHNVYSDPKDVLITCRISGIQERDPPLTFELIDLSRRTLAELSGRLDGEVIALKNAKVSRSDQKSNLADAEAEHGYQGEMRWQPPITGYGFYRIRVRMLGKSDVLHERTVSLAVVRPQPPLTGGEFGWSLPHGEKPLSMNAMAGLLAQAGISWAKFPVWYDATDNGRAEQVARFAERLSTQRIELVGLLDTPPPEARKLFAEGDERLPAAGIFADPALWSPAINPVMTRLALKVRWWQLGGDDDTSFMGHPELHDKVGQVKEHVGRFGQELHLGIAWRWLNELPTKKNPPWEYVALGANPSLTADELTTYLNSQPTTNERRWVMLEPLPKNDYDVNARALDLVSRMLAAKMNRADAAFATDPFDPRTGLMEPDGAPGELFLPWRTTALMISGTQFLGSITMPGGSRNYILTRGDEAVMVVWNDTPTSEAINLGDPREIEHIDLWGRVTQPEQRGHDQVYNVGPLPTFITGISRELALWRMHFRFEQSRLQSLYGRPQYPTFRVKNPFPQGAGGSMTIHTPDAWGKPPLPVSIKLAGGEERTDRFEIVLRSDASTGEQPVRVDFDLTVDRDYKFSVYTTMELGLGDVAMDFETQFDERGNLVVRQRLVNKTDEFVNFKCFLFAPGRRRLRQNVLNLSRGTNLKIYTLPDGEDLIGKTLWVRAEEMAGDRVLNYRFEVQD